MLRLHLTTVRIVIIKKTITVNTGREVNRWEGLYDPAIPLLGIFPKDTKKTEIHSQQCFTEALLTIAKS